jgi:antitoxin component YwqK of YwqJK toxin-antitoxin module
MKKRLELTIFNCILTFIIIFHINILFGINSSPQTTYEVKFYSNGNIFSKSSTKGKKWHGLSYLYYPNKQMFFKGEYSNGSPSGQRFFYYKTGELINGKFDITLPEYNVQYIGFCKNGLPENEMVGYKSNELIFKVNYQNGRIHGEYQLFKNNKNYKTLIYSKGILIDTVNKYPPNKPETEYELKLYKKLKDDMFLIDNDNGVFFGLDFDMDIEDVFKILQTNIQGKEPENGNMKSRFDYEYKAPYFDFYTQNNKLRLIVCKSKGITDAGIKLGDSYKDVLKAYGEPRNDKPERITKMYIFKSHVIFFVIVNERVQAIRIKYLKI